MNRTDTPRPTMTDDEMLEDYPRLRREYTLLHEEYRRLYHQKLRGKLNNRTDNEITRTTKEH